MNIELIEIYRGNAIGHREGIMFGGSVNRDGTVDVDSWTEL